MSLPDLDRILRTAVAARASDVHLAPTSPALARVDAELVPVGGDTTPLDPDWLEDTLVGILPEAQRDQFHVHREVDLSYTVPGVARFRVNMYQELRGVAAAFRPIAESIRSLDSMNLPPIVKQLAMLPRGLVLVTGATGSGKSTTLAGMIDAINAERSVHVVTVEDPIEFVHTNKRALINQREVGTDTRSFAEALRRVLRQDPDVILIGELRDLETMEVALTAAETGHLVFGTLHTQGAANSINRIVDAFPAHQQNQVRAQLSDTLQGVVSQTLLRRASGTGRVAATEIMVRTNAVANLVREGQVSQLYSAIQTGSTYGMHTLDQDLRRLVEKGEISIHEALRVVVDATALDNVVVRPEGHLDSWSAPVQSLQSALQSQR
ncbi:MAG: type IV pilus twitching motility protein PilT [Nocardioides sp.]|uniref:type IV pilus twitching motility protein PilT n=1 Tax=Nocardioides sp. TaxID=35761 RepID=UPI003F047933